LLATVVSAQQVFARIALETGLLADPSSKRKTVPALAAAVCGFRAERMEEAHLALSARLPEYEPDQLQRALLERRSVVRTWGVRGVLQILPTPQLGEFLAASALVAPRWRRALESRSNLTTAARTRLLKRLGPEVLGRDVLRDAIPDATTRHFMLREAAQHGLLVAQEGEGQQTSYVWTAAWLGREVEPERDVHALVGRYLTAFGPVGAPDLANWLGVTVASARTLMAKHRVEEVQVEGEDVPTFMRPDDLEALVRTRKTQARGVVVIPPGDPVLAASRTRFRGGLADAENTGFGCLDGRPVLAWTLHRGSLIFQPLDGEPHHRIRKAVEHVVERAGIALDAEAGPA
jgi:hypothetical protein